MTKPILALILAVGVWAGLATSPAKAVTAPGNHSYKLFQDGYSEGATVTGSFAGADLDGNGILVHFPSDVLGGPPIEHLELTSFVVHFSGNSFAPAFDLTLDDLFGFVYEVDSSGLGDDPAFDPAIGQDLTEGVGAVGDHSFFTSGLGPNRILGGYIGGAIDINSNFGNLADLALDESANLVQVTPVPEPASIALMMAATLAPNLIRRISTVGRRRTRS